MSDEHTSELIPRGEVMCSPVRVVDFKKAARKLQLELIERALQTVQCEPDLAGFAIVAWDHRGATTTTVHTNEGPISHGMLPAFVADALNRRIAAEDAVHRITGKSRDDEPA